MNTRSSACTAAEFHVRHASHYTSSRCSRAYHRKRSPLTLETDHSAVCIQRQDSLCDRLLRDQTWAGLLRTIVHKVMFHVVLHESARVRSLERLKRPLLAKRLDLRLWHHSVLLHQIYEKYTAGHVTISTHHCASQTDRVSLCLFSS